MRGHEAIIERRIRERRIPARVSLWLMPVQPWRLSASWNPRYPVVEVRDEEPISSLDLRWLVGLNVSISGPDPMRLREAFAACVAARAKHVQMLLYVKDPVDGLTYGPIYGECSRGRVWNEPKPHWPIEVIDKALRRALDGDLHAR